MVLCKELKLSLNPKIIYTSLTKVPIIHLAILITVKYLLSHSLRTGSTSKTAMTMPIKAATSGKNRTR